MQQYFPAKRFVWMVVILLFPMMVFCQGGRELTTSNNRARRAFEDGVQKYSYRDAAGAEASFRDAIRHDANFIEAYIILGEMFVDLKQYRKAIDVFSQAARINPTFFPNIFLYMGESHMALGEYADAQRQISRFISIPNISSGMHERATNLQDRIAFAIELKNNPVPFEPINLGSKVNTEHDEYAPTLTADEQTLIFTRKRPREDMNFRHLGPFFEDFYVTNRVDGVWGPAVNLGPPINTQNNEGAQSISADGMYLYFTACGRPGGRGSCDIYRARRIGQGWSEPENLGPPVNTSAWESQPSISPDGKTLYFTSNRQGNTGRMDIWVTTQIADNKWSEPENLGAVINTSGREMSPFIHPDNRTLFFASDGHMGMGGMDLFFTTRDDEGNWQKPINLGYPINTHADEISLVVGASGKEAYFASEQPGGQGGTDLYFFELYEEVRPTPVTYMKGFVFDAQSRRRLDAKFQLIDLTSEEIMVQSTSNTQTGEFLIPIPVRTNLALNVWRDGYLFFSENFSFDDVRTGVDPHLYDIPLQPIREGESVVLRNIFFGTDSDKLLPESVTELRKLLDLLNANPGLSIEIGGHTDNTGSFAHNKDLSERRALSVLNFLTDNGIARERLSYTGYADQKPIATNTTEEGRAQNRRTEFKVTKNN